MSRNNDAEYITHFHATIDILKRLGVVHILGTADVLEMLGELLSEPGSTSASYIRSARQFFEEVHGSEGYAETLKRVARILWDPSTDEKSLKGSICAYTLACELYSRAAMNYRDRDATVALADLYARGFHGAEKMPGLAIPLYEEIIDSSRDTDGSVMCRLGKLYAWQSDPALQNRSTGMFKRAVEEKGNLEACYLLACAIQEQSDSQNYDVSEVIDLLKRAVEGTNIPDAPYRLSEAIYSKHKKRAINLLEHASSLGSTQAKAKLARFLSEGTSMILQDKARAKALCSEVLALERNAEAYFVLGNLEKNSKRSLELKLVGLSMEYNQRAVVEVAELVVSEQRKKQERKLEEIDKGRSNEQRLE